MSAQNECQQPACVNTDTSFPRTIIKPRGEFPYGKPDDLIHSLGITWGCQWWTKFPILVDELISTMLNIQYGAAHFATDCSFIKDAEPLTRVVEYGGVDMAIERANSGTVYLPYFMGARLKDHGPASTEWTTAFMKFISDRIGGILGTYDKSCGCTIGQYLDRVHADDEFMTSAADTKFGTKATKHTKHNVQFVATGTKPSEQTAAYTWTFLPATVQKEILIRDWFNTVTIDLFDSMLDPAELEERLRATGNFALASPILATRRSILPFPKEIYFNCGSASPIGTLVGFPAANNTVTIAHPVECCSDQTVYVDFNEVKDIVHTETVQGGNAHHAFKCTVCQCAIGGLAYLGCGRYRILHRDAVPLCIRCVHTYIEAAQKLWLPGMSIQIPIESIAKVNLPVTTPTLLAKYRESLLKDIPNDAPAGYEETVELVIRALGELDDGENVRIIDPTDHAVETEHLIFVREPNACIFGDAAQYLPLMPLQPFLALGGDDRPVPPCISLEDLQKQ